MDSKSVIRFWSRLNKDGPVPPHAPHLGKCWEWTGWRDRDGYAKSGVLQDGKWKRFLAHRLAWVITHGEIPFGFLVLHRCDNPPCCNPAHLFVGTQKENLADCVRKGRVARGVMVHTARLTEDDVRTIRRLYGRGGVSQYELAARFGVYQRTISEVVRGESWKHVGGNGIPRARQRTLDLESPEPEAT